jgi:4-hydroxy 2-oxovalerate aldolase
LNVFNVSNYEQTELDKIVDDFAKNPMDFLYFADTHGTLDLSTESESLRFSSLAEKIKAAGSKPGFHLHNHSGRALKNFEALEQMGFEYADASVNGLGKGLGNLKMEEVLPAQEAVPILQLWADNTHLFEMPQNPYGIIGAKYSMTDHYAEQALEMGLTLEGFVEFAQQADRETRDNFDVGALRRFKTRLSD